MTEIEKDLAHIRLIEREIQAYQAQAELLTTSIQTHRKAIETLDAIPGLKEGDEILIPIGGGVILRMSWDGGSRVMLDVGAGVVVEESAEDARIALESRVRQMEAAMTQVEARLRELRAQHAAVGQKVQRAYQGSMDVPDAAG
ncbi:MAG TPA: prefoldin subunit alpha [Thermoplasmata archaeon]|nr:prefoldin subunit alpha [Thermoplasmata archaeon]